MCLVNGVALGDSPKKSVGKMSAAVRPRKNVERWNSSDLGGELKYCVCTPVWDFVRPNFGHEQIVVIDMVSNSGYRFSLVLS